MNFRRFLAFFLATFLILTLFSGCKGKNKPTLQEKPGEIEETKVVFSESIEKTDKVGLYELGSEITKNTENIKIVAGDETAYLCSLGESSLEVIHFSVFENKKLATTTLNGTNWHYGVLVKDEFYAIELSSATLFVYDRNGSKKSETKLDETALSFAFLERQGENVIYKKADSNTLYKLNLKTKEKTNTVESFDLSGNPSYDETAVYVKTTAGISYSISFKDLTVTKTRTESFREYYGPVGIATEKDFFTIALLNTGKEKIMLKKFSPEEKFLCANDTMLITKTENYVKAYNFMQGLVTKNIGKEKEKVIDAAFVGDDYIFVAARKAESTENVYRLLKLSEEEEKDTVICNRLFDKVVYQSVLEGNEEKDTTLSDKIADEYGVRFLYGKMGSDFKTDFSYSLTSQKDATAKIALAEKIFRVFPNEMLKEATNNREIWVYLCQGLDNKGKDYTKKAGTTELYNHKVIFIDIACEENEFVELLYHQFAHILDEYMPNNVKEGFSALTPDKVKKSGENEKYTQESKSEEVWFYNKNCKISEEEDRVTTLGEMFNAIYSSTPGECFVSENVKKKADFMAKALIENFEICQKNPNGPWEVYIIKK